MLLAVTDIASGIASACGLGALAMLAAYIPARRAARIDPCQRCGNTGHLVAGKAEPARLDRIRVC
jgi:hypothetical protein